MSGIFNNQTEGMSENPTNHNSPVTEYRVQGKEFMGVYASQTKQADCKSVPSGSVVQIHPHPLMLIRYDK